MCYSGKKYSLLMLDLTSPTWAGMNMTGNLHYAARFLCIAR